jgi:hypothetical protein
MVDAGLKPALLHRYRDAFATKFKSVAAQYELHLEGSPGQEGGPALQPEVHRARAAGRRLERDRGNGYFRSQASPIYIEVWDAGDRIHRVRAGALDVDCDLNRERSMISRSRSDQNLA